MVVFMSINSTADLERTDVSHKSSMDKMYRVQRHFYDVTRAYYLLGRDRLIDMLDPPASGTVLEIGCGTGRNIIMASQRFPHARFFGIDISDEMLKSATAALAKSPKVGSVRLAQADALTFNPATTFGQDRFDRIYFSYTLSMIPDWQGAIRKAMDLLSPIGELHIVDFGQCEQLPGFVRTVMGNWLSRFHVTPRRTIREFISHAALVDGKTIAFNHSHRGYAWHIRVLPVTAQDA
jgi:S-adenosylmethionine-diacylgycerolhomoserine-N-methlytransferase